MNRHTDALAKVYARSLFELATKAGGNETVLEIADELEQISTLTKQHCEMSLFFSSPAIGETSRLKAIKAIFEDKITTLTLRFLLVLNSKGRLGHLQAISNAYGQLLQESLGKVDVDVFTPTAIDVDSIAHIKQHLVNAIGKEPIIHPYIDNEMIGGIKFRIGDQLIDGSVQTKLRRISASIQAGGSKAIREQVNSYLEETN